MGDLVGDRVVVLGGGMGGLLSGRVLADHFREVVLVDRDRLHEAGYRRSVPQGRHAHALIAKGNEILTSLFPGLHDDLRQGGVIPGDFSQDIDWYMHGRLLKSEYTGLLTVPATRPVLEYHIRRRVEAIPNITFLEETDILGLATTPDGRRVTGARVQRHGGAEEVLSADLVVDSTGRGSRSPAWLEELGYGRPEEERVKIGLAYTTRHYELDADPFGDKLALIQVGTPGNPRGGIFYRVPGEGHKVELSLTGVLGDHAPTDPEGFLEFARTLPEKSVYETVKDAKPVDDPVKFTFPASVWRHYERLPRFPDNYLVIADAVCIFNPVYGQGMTVAGLEALTLQRHLAGGSLPDARAFFADVAKDIADPWAVSTGGDLGYPEAEGRRTAMTRFAGAYVTKLQHAAADDVALSTAFMRVAGLVDPPQALLRPGRALRVLRHSLFRPASTPTPEPNGSPVSETERQPHASVQNRDSAG